MSSGRLISFAGVALLATIFLAIATWQPGTQFLYAVLAGIAAYVTVWLTVVAVRADQRERSEKARDVR